MTRVTHFIVIAAATVFPVRGAFADTMSVDDVIDLAKAEVVARYGISATDIRMVQTQAAEWRDSSLGCPQKGMQYQPVITAGYRVVVMSATHDYTVHVANRRAVICGTPSAAAGQRVAVRDESIMNLVNLAREDLEARVADATLPITVKSVTRTSWPDGRLGCPGTGDDYVQEETPGVIIELEHNGDLYPYHAGERRVIRCDTSP